MLEIFVCEDDPEQRKRLNSYIENYIMMENLDMKLVISTGRSQDILDYLQNNRVTGLYFLDVDLQEEKSGIALGAEIRQYDSLGAIVFVTTHSELTYLTFTYKVEAMDYITKDKFTDIRQRVIECIDTANTRYLQNKYNNIKKFQTKSGDKMISVDYNDILFFETSPQLHKIILHAKNRQVEFYGKLKDILEMDSRFYRCHNSFVVNKDNIAEVDTKNREIRMTNGEICYASSRFLGGLKDIIPH
ncbi:MULTISPECIES: LytTR family DNA-binding domain-containing protein [Paenibacillus]|uniref:Two component transcriptional regulator, LytTR family n=1 Tax=Paenibacillus typhae TaxID=1174501 RepID=A0A1G8ICE9_9BACL|nr:MULTISPECIES: LytTR family DNA-binding domain-containing protein [Paenibacillus]MBY0012883.1 response regulator transcription factor [Paenibacillus typhae]MDF9843917.1 two-component system response regulator AgrA [Paenibacillus sp. PastF-2]MDF9850522.1 two-component system response regulator AgrA [Paenibacillus sp. PastM-2]MDF9856248.1 two-component system response regulator AgrA [Paenibacillus sp. PastF-1]MDH6481523.1 two-component system response regulator AgrA [Paenibacillus sp. PastH-2]